MSKNLALISLQTHGSTNHLYLITLLNRLQILAFKVTTVPFLHMAKQELEKLILSKGPPSMLMKHMLEVCRLSRRNLCR